MFNNFYIEPQKQNYEAVKNRAFTYIKIDENKPEHPKNRVRDSKGRPIKKYIEPIDYYVKNEVN